MEKHLFRVYDTNNDGYIDFVEFMVRLLRPIYEGKYSSQLPNTTNSPFILGVIKPAWNHPKTSQAKPSQAGLAWLVLQKRGSWLGLAWLVNSRRGHWLGFDLAFRQATHHDYI